MPEYKDQTGRFISLQEKPLRVISLVPSQSEFIWDLGLRNELVGITKFCIHPNEMRRNIKSVGGTKNIDLKKVRELKPDLIIGNKEENDQFQIEVLQKEFKVWMSDIYTLEDSFYMMQSLGDVLAKSEEAMVIVNEIKRSLAGIKDFFIQQRVAYFIWHKPYMLAAKNTFIDHVLEYLGLTNVLAHVQRYPEVDAEVLKKINPELCFLSSEPFPFKEKHVIELQKTIPDANIMIVDGEVFSWYGSRLLYLERYVKTLALRRAQH